LSLSPSSLTSHGHGFSTWHAYDPSCKAELWSTLFSNSRETILFDPIDWPKDNPPLTPHVIIIRTNSNHDRFCKEMAELVQGKIETEVAGFEKIPLPGAGDAETAYFHPESKTLVVGDALINFPPHGLTLLPDKYCTDPVQLRQSVRRLSQLPIERIFFAHGAPIVHSGLSQLSTLLS
jgi:glyoxylase-like metal-dependent hydrolase (beta-lactamase superfamily II)